MHLCNNININVLGWMDDLRSVAQMSYKVL